MHPHGSTKATHLRLLVQVFDSGLIGEGVLHMVAWAKMKLMTEDAVLVSHKHQLSSHSPDSDVQSTLVRRDQPDCINA